MVGGLGHCSRVPQLENGMSVKLSILPATRSILSRLHVVKNTGVGDCNLEMLDDLPQFSRNIRFGRKPPDKVEGHVELLATVFVELSLGVIGGEEDHRQGRVEKVIEASCVGAIDFGGFT